MVSLSKRILSKVASATIKTVILACCFFVALIFGTSIFSIYPELRIYLIFLAVHTIFFTLINEFTEGTIYKFIFKITRALFLIVYFTYVLSEGAIKIEIMNFSLLFEITPILSLIILINILYLVQGLLQALEFASQS